MQPSCEKCVFAAIVETWTECRFHAPKPGAMTQACWPNVQPDDFCGQFRPAALGFPSDDGVYEDPERSWK